jgi:hypothetical protein
MDVASCRDVLPGVADRLPSGSKARELPSRIVWASKVQEEYPRSAFSWLLMGSSGQAEEISTCFQTVGYGRLQLNNSQEGNKAMGREAKQNCRRSTINPTIPSPDVVLMTFVYAGRTKRKLTKYKDSKQCPIPSVLQTRSKIRDRISLPPYSSEVEYPKLRPGGFEPTWCLARNTYEIQMD